MGHAMTRHPEPFDVAQDKLSEGSVFKKQILRASRSE
jgi:hypothetical protein